MKLDFTGVEYPHDCKKIVAAALLHGNCLLTPEAAEEAWEDYSDSMAAGWMLLPDDLEDVWRSISYYFEEE